MKKPFLIYRPIPSFSNEERGVTMILVAVCMVAIIAMAALSIDVVTLYLSKEEAQRAADTAALAAARVISISGITGTADPDTDGTQWQAICGTSGSATLAAKATARLNSVGGVVPTSVSVTYSVQGGPAGSTDCSSLATAFAINPTVIVQVTRTGLPTLFSRIWSRNSNTVSATAVAEAFNPSDSGSIASGGQVIPVHPRCVKPWILRDQDPSRSPTTHSFARQPNGSIRFPGIFPVDGGVIGESFTMNNACTGANCTNMEGSALAAGQYVPVLINSSPAPTAVAASCSSDNYQEAIAGCDVSTVYQCGYNGTSPTQADFTINPGSDTSSAVQCVTGMSGGGNDTIDASVYPFQIKAGSGNSIAPANQLITASNSIMTIPLTNAASFPSGVSQPPVNIVGFLQVFVNTVDSSGNMTVTVLNVSGCSDNASTASFAPGSSPVPIRLVTPQ